MKNLFPTPTGRFHSSFNKSPLLEYSSIMRDDAVQESGHRGRIAKSRTDGGRCGRLHRKWAVTDNLATWNQLTTERNLSNPSINHASNPARYRAPPPGRVFANGIVRRPIVAKFCCWGKFDNSGSTVLWYAVYPESPLEASP